jgi:hypothetical protein
MLNRTVTALSLAAALIAVAPVASAQHDRDYRDDHRDYRHDVRRDHHERERERIARERRYEYARHHDYRVYAPRGYAVAAPVFVPPPVVYSPPPPSGINIVVPITFP